MARGGAQRLIPAFFAAFVICASLALGGAAHAAPNPVLDKLEAKLTNLSIQLKTDANARALPLWQLLRRAGLDGLTRELPTGFGPYQAPQRSAQSMPMADASLKTFRTALTMLTQVHGGQDNLDILLAHPEGQTEALTFRNGMVTLAHIQASLKAQGLGSSDAVLRTPVILWEDTVLRLTPGERLLLSRPDGAFLISFGRVEIEGARIATNGGENPHSKDFVPFVTIAGGGSLYMRDTSLKGLGFGNTPKFSGLSVVAHTLMPATGKSLIINSHFEDLVTLSLTGVDGAVVSGNRFFDMRKNALLLSTATHSAVEGNLFFGKSPTNAVRVLRGSDDSVVKGNVMLEGDRAGILVQGQSNRVEVSGNVIWRRSGGAIKLSRTQCGVVRHNVILDSLQKGIDIRSSDRTLVHANTISGSGSAGIWVSAQPRAAETFLSDNILRGNKSGLATATGAELVLAGNDFTDQFPRFVDGDVVLQNQAIVRDLRGATPVVINAAETRYPRQRAQPDCAAGVLE